MDNDCDPGYERFPLMGFFTPQPTFKTDYYIVITVDHEVDTFVLKVGKWVGNDFVVQKQVTGLEARKFYEESLSWPKDCAKNLDELARRIISMEVEKDGYS